MIRAAALAPVAVFVRPLSHRHRVHSFIREGGYHNGHSGRPAPVAADIVGAVGLAGITLVQLVEIDYRRHAVCKGNIAQRGDAVSSPFRQVLQQAVPQEHAQV